MSIFDKISGRFGDILDEVRIPEDLHRAHEEALAKISAGAPEQAIELLQAMVLRHPDTQRTFILLARSYRHLKRWKLMADAVERALTIRESASLHVQAADAYEALKQWGNAEKHLLQATSLPDGKDLEFETSCGLARVYTAIARPDKAEREMHRASRLQPENLHIGHQLVRLMLDRDVAEAAALLSKIDKNITDPKSQILMALILERQGNLDKACSFLMTSIEHVTDAEALLTLARIRLTQGLPDLASQAIEGLPDINDPLLKTLEWRIRGECASALKNWTEARNAYLHLLGKLPEDASALVGLGFAELELGHSDVASGFLLQAMPHLGTRGRALLGIGRLHAERGDVSGARHFLEESLRAETTEVDRAQAHLEIARILSKSSDHSAVLQHLHEAQKDPELLDLATAMRLETLDRLKPRFEFPEDPYNPMSLEGVITQVVKWVTADPRLSEFVSPAQSLVQKLESPLSLAIVGEFNAGKSTLLNALLEEDLLPVGVLPTTAHTGIVRFGPRRAARLHYLNASPQEVRFEEASRIMKDNSAEVERVEFMFPHPVLRALEFWDTPGFNALEERHESVASSALENAEAIIWVMDANQVLSASEFDRIDGLRNGRERLIVVLNKIDRLGNDRTNKLAELIAYVEENIGEQIAGTFGLSAQEAAAARPNNTPDFENFREFIDTHVVERAGRLKVLEVLRQLGVLFNAIHAFGDQRADAMVELGDRVAQISIWVESDARAKANALIENQRRNLEDKTSYLLLSIEHEIAESLRPAGQILSRPSLAAEDAKFIGRLLRTRFSDVVDESFDEVAHTLNELEGTLARRLEDVVQRMPLLDARAQHRSIEGLFDELRASRQLLYEKVVGRLDASVGSRIELVGNDILLSLDGDKALWRSKLRRLLPDTSRLAAMELTSWFNEWFHRVSVFLERIASELDLLKIETDHRYDSSEMSSWLDAISTPNASTAD